MIKTLAKLFKQEKENFVVPKGVQDVIPIKAIYDDGIFKVGKDKFSNVNTDRHAGNRHEYENRLSEIKESNTYDIIEMSGSKAEWKEVLTVYSVKVNTDTDNPQEVVTMDEGKRQLFKDIFWEMNSISSRTESKEETVVTESDDGNGNAVRTETTVTKTYLYITVTHKTADEMAEGVWVQ